MAKNKPLRKISKDKYIDIIGKRFKVNFDKKSNGASFSIAKQEISLGTKASNEQIMENFLHEIVESILSERDLRYSLEHQPVENGDFIFIFGHNQFEQWIKDLAVVLKNLYET